MSDPSHSHNRTPTRKDAATAAADSGSGSKDSSLWPVLRKLLDPNASPVGSFTLVEWQQARQIMAAITTSSTASNSVDTRPPITAELVNCSWMLLERLVQEQAATTSTSSSSQATLTSGAWICHHFTLQQLIVTWRKVAKQQQQQQPMPHRQTTGNNNNNNHNDDNNVIMVLSPAALARGLEKLSRLLPAFRYDISTLNMIMNVAVHQSQPGNKKLATAEQFMMYIRTLGPPHVLQLRPSVVTWNQYLSYYCANHTNSGGGNRDHRMRRSQSLDMVDKMEDLLRQMKSEGVEPDVISWTQLMQAWAMSGLREAPSKMEELLERIKSQGIVEPDVVMWTLVVKAWACSSLPGTADKIESLLQRMKKEGVTPNVVTWSHVLSFWAGSGLPEAPIKADDIVRRMVEEGTEPNAITWTQVLKTWSDSGLPEAPYKMQEILERMKAQGCQPDVVTWTQIIKAWAASGLPEAPAKMNEALQRMQEEPYRCQPNVVTWNQVLAYWAASGSPDAPDRVEEILDSMKPVQPNVMSFTIAIQACLRADDPDRAEGLIDRMSAAGTSPTTRTFNELLAAWSKVGGIVAAEETEHILGLMHQRSQDDPAAAPDIWSVGMVLAAWTRSQNSNALERVQEIYSQLEAGDFAGIKPDYVTCFTVVAYLAKSGRRDALERADQILRRFLDEHDGIIGKGQYDVYSIMVRAWIERKQVDKADSLLLHWKKCYSDGKVVSVPAFYVFRVLLLELIDSGDLERADAIFYQWHELFSSGVCEEGPDGPTLARLRNGWRQSSHPEKERFILSLENAPL
jgi:pentatricopeptide repeat protein